MKFERMLSVLCVMFGLCFIANAAETTIVSGDNLLKAMHRMGCTQEWLSVVMRHSNILESELTSLQIGTHVYAPDVCKTESPSAEDIAVTKQIFKNQSVLQRARTAKQDLSEVQSSEVADPVSSFRPNEVSGQPQTIAVPQLSATLQSQSSEKKFGSHAMAAAVSGSSLLSFCVSGLIWFLWWRRIQDRTKLVPHVRSISWSTFSQPNGVRYFELSRVLYRCPDHANDEIEEKNLEHHLRKCHYDAQDNQNPVRRKEQQLELIQRRLGRAGIC